MFRPTHADDRIVLVSDPSAPLPAFGRGVPLRSHHLFEDTAERRHSLLRRERATLARVGHFVPMDTAPVPASVGWLTSIA